MYEFSAMKNKLNLTQPVVREGGGVLLFQLVCIFLNSRKFDRFLSKIMKKADLTHENCDTLVKGIE